MLDFLYRVLCNESPIVCSSVITTNQMALKSVTVCEAVAFIGIMVSRVHEETKQTQFFAPTLIQNLSESILFINVNGHLFS